MSHFKLDFLGYRVVVLSLESHLIPGFQFPHLSETEGNGTECFLRFFSNIMSMILSFEKINGIKVTLLMRHVVLLKAEYLLQKILGSGHFLLRFDS